MQIDVYHHTSTLEPAPDLSLVEDLVEFTQKTFTTSKRGRLVEQVCTLTLHDVHCEKRPAIPTGLVPAVADRLRDAGLQVEVNDRREFGPAHKPSKQVWMESDGDDRRLLQAVKRHPLGQIETSSTTAMIQQMHLIHQFFSEAKILIVVATRKSAWKLWQELRRFVRSAVRLKSGSWPRRPPPILVTTYPPLASCDPEQWDIILLPNAEHATQDRFSGVMNAFIATPYRCYSFVRPGQQMGRRSRIRLEAISGQVIYEVEPGRPAMEVLWVQPPQQDPSRCERRTLEWKRTAYWHNEVRNQLIAEAAQAFATKDVKKLQEYGVRFENGEPALANSEAPKVVLLVESVEHGQELLKRLDGWALLDSAADRRNDSGVKGEIITVTRAAARGLDADVIIQTVGNAGSGMFRNTIIERSTAADHLPAITVDFADSGDDMAAADARGRMRAYERLGWERHGYPARSSSGRENRAAARQKEVAP